MQILLSLIFWAICILLIIVVLVQRARGGGLAGAFGMGGSDTFLGAIQNKEIVRWTTWLAIAFILLAVVRDFIPPARRGADVSTVSVDAPLAPQGGTAEQAGGAATGGTSPGGEGAGASAPSVERDEAIPSGGEAPPAAPSSSGGGQ